MASQAGAAVEIAVLLYRESEVPVALGSLFAPPGLALAALRERLWDEEVAPTAGFVFLSRRGHVVTRAQERVRTLLQVWDDAEQAVWLAPPADDGAVALAALFTRRLQAAARAGAAPTVRVRLPAACVADVSEEKSDAAANRQRQLAALRAAEAAEAAAEEHDGLLDRLGAFVGGLFARGDVCGDGGASTTAAAATGEAAEEAAEEEAAEEAEEAKEGAMPTRSSKRVRAR